MPTPTPATIPACLAQIDSLVTQIHAVAAGHLDARQSGMVLLQLQAFVAAATSAHDGIVHSLSSMSTESNKPL